MKLVYAIMSNDDSKVALSILTKSGFYVTKISSTGGFLSDKNTTLMICTEDEKVDDLIELIKKQCKKSKKVVPLPMSQGVGSYTTVPAKMSVGGATIFVTNIERFEKD